MLNFVLFYSLSLYAEEIVWLPSLRMVEYLLKKMVATALLSQKAQVYCIYAYKYPF